MTSPRRSLTRTLAEIAHALESPQDVETRLRTVLELLQDLVPYDYCTLLRTRDDRVHPLTVCPEVDQAEQARVRAELERLLHLVQESPLADSDAAALAWSDQRRGQDRLAPEWQTRLSIPLVGLDRVIGLLAVGRRAPYAYGEEDVSLLAIVAAQLAAYVAALSAQARAREGLQLLAAAGNLLGESFDVTDRLQRIADLAVPALGDRCTAAVADDSGAIMFQAVASALPAAEEARIRKLTECYPLRATAPGAADYALLTSHAQVIAHIREQMKRSAAWDEESLQALRGLPYTSLISVPLAARGKTLGTIEFLRTGARSPYGPGDMPLAQELARRAALALDNARLYQDTVEARASAEQAVERLTLLHRATAGLAGAVTMTSVADVIATQSMASLGANGAVVSVLSDDGASFTNLRITGYPVQAMAAWREYRMGAATPLGDAAHERDLVIVDSPEASTPGMDGLAALREIRSLSAVPVIMLSAQGGEDDKVHALRLGADYYLTAPVGQGELLARIECALRRAVPREALVVDADLTIDFARNRVIRRGQEEPLTATEHRVLYHLVTSAGRLLPFEALLTRVWGPAYREHEHYVRLYVSYLRAKIEPDPAHPKYILTEKGLGYRFAALGAHRRVPGQGGDG